MRRAAVLLSLALILAAGATAESPDAQTILKNTRDAYANLKSYEIQATSSLQTLTADTDQTSKSKLIIASEQPGKFRVEAKSTGGITMVSDGSQTWTYNSYLKQYTKTPAGQTIVKAFATGTAAMLYPERPGDIIKSARLLGEEKFAVEGSPRPCYTLEVEYEPKTTAYKAEERPSKFWIDKKTYLVLKRTSEQHIELWPPTGGPAEIKNAVSVESLKVDVPLSAELFAFTPPATARLVDSFEYPGMKKSSLVGRQAMDFKLRDLSGRDVQLASFRGKIVLLDFWATWCAPCRAEMPVLEKIQKDNKDLVLLGIDVGEDEDLVRKFVQENKSTYPILLGGHEPVINDYDAHSLPAVAIIDRSGKIRTYQTGYGTGTDAQLRAGLSEAERPAPPVGFVPPTTQVTGGTGTGTVGGAYRVGGGVTAPGVLSKRDPEYSEEARKAHVSGTVLLSLVISPDGVARDIKVVRPLGLGLDEKAVEAVQQWKFRPGMKDGVPVAVQSNIEINFRLQDGPNGVHGPVASASKPDEPEGDPQNAEEAYRRGAHLVRTGRVEEGIAMFNRAIAMKKDWPQAYVARARAQYRQKRYNEAIKDLDEAIRLDPKDANWYDTRGLAYSNSGRHARAIEDYTRAIELNPSAALFYDNRGWAHMESGQPEKAVADLTKAIQIGPDYSSAYEHRATAYMRLENWKLAIADCTAALQLNPSRYFYEKRAEAKRAAGDATGAAQDTQKAGQMPVPTAGAQ